MAQSTVLPQPAGPTNYVLVYAGLNKASFAIPPDSNPQRFLEQVPALFRAEYGSSPRSGNPWRKAVLIVEGREADVMYFIAD